MERKPTRFIGKHAHRAQEPSPNRLGFLFGARCGRKCALWLIEDSADSTEARLKLDESYDNHDDSGSAESAQTAEPECEEDRAHPRILSPTRKTRHPARGDALCLVIGSLRDAMWRLFRSRHGGMGSNIPHLHVSADGCTLQVFRIKINGIRPENSACRVPAFVRLDSKGQSFCEGPEGADEPAPAGRNGRML